MGEEGVLQQLADAVALWSGGAAPPANVIDAACDALVAGLDTPSLRAVAGMPQNTSTFDLEDAIEPLMEELGLRYAPPRSEEAAIAAAGVFARLCARGTMPPREFVAWMHANFRHGFSDALEPFLVFDDEYDTVEYTGRSVEGLDAEVIQAARRLLAR